MNSITSASRIIQLPAYEPQPPRVKKPRSWRYGRPQWLNNAYRPRAGNKPPASCARCQLFIECSEAVNKGLKAGCEETGLILNGRIIE